MSLSSNFSSLLNAVLYLLPSQSSSFLWMLTQDRLHVFSSHLGQQYFAAPPLHTSQLPRLQRTRTNDRIRTHDGLLQSRWRSVTRCLPIFRIHIWKRTSDHFGLSSIYLWSDKVDFSNSCRHVHRDHNIWVVKIKLNAHTTERRERRDLSVSSTKPTNYCILWLNRCRKLCRNSKPAWFYFLNFIIILFIIRKPLITKRTYHRNSFFTSKHHLQLVTVSFQSNVNFIFQVRA